MEKTFDFEQVGKRMPYTVPDGFFDKFEENVMESLTPSPSPKERGVYTLKDRIKGKNYLLPSPLREGLGVRLLFAVAAAIALFFVVRATLPKAASEREQIDARIAFAEREQARPKVKSDPVLASADDFASVELAFNNLSAEDQDFLIQVYEEDDLFINP